LISLYPLFLFIHINFAQLLVRILVPILLNLLFIYQIIKVVFRQ
jgi:hypothetical protein